MWGFGVKIPGHGMKCSVDRWIWVGLDHEFCKTHHVALGRGLGMVSVHNKWWWLDRNGMEKDLGVVRTLVWDTKEGTGWCLWPWLFMMQTALAYRFAQAIENLIPLICLPGFHYSFLTMFSGCVYVRKANIRTWLDVYLLTSQLRNTPIVHVRRDDRQFPG